MIPAPAACPCCGSTALAKLGEDVTETLEVIPRQWKVIQHVREKFTCRRCETISQLPAPFHPTPRGWAGPSLLAMILFEKYGQHQPLNRQSERDALEGVALSLSTLADQVGACAVVLRPLYELIRTHVLAAERVHGDDTQVPVLARARPRRAACGPTSGMTAPSADPTRRPPCSSTPRIGAILPGWAEQLSVAEVARRAGVGRPAVWRWQRRFAEAGVDGLLRDATRTTEELWSTIGRLLEACPPTECANYHRHCGYGVCPP